MLLGSAQLPEFPSGANSRLKLPHGVSRVATHEDFGFLRRLYGSFRMEEMEPVPWPPEMKWAFIDQQFDLQHRHYTARFSSADFLILLQDTQQIGRLYVDSCAALWHIIDIGLMPQWRNAGKGQVILESIQHQAKVHAASGIMLHVERRNTRAQALYRRLNFREIEASETHIQMQWTAS